MFVGSILPNGRFSAGHRLCIQVFVQGVQKCFTPKVTLGKNKSVCGRSDIKGKKAKTDPKQSDSMFASARRQIAKWQKQQTNEMRELTEQKHFEVHVDLGNNEESIPIVVCLLCNHKCLLGNKNGLVLISNWTRHVSKCIKQVGLNSTNKSVGSWFQRIVHIPVPVSPPLLPPHLPGHLCYQRQILRQTSHSEH